MSQKTAPALHWLRTNGNEFGFASNYFGKIENAADFAEALSAMGGVKDVQVTNIDDSRRRIKHEGGPIADTFLVTLDDPEDEHTKDILRHLRADEIDEIAPGVIRLWWD